jgi:hypothetical protein
LYDISAVDNLYPFIRLVPFWILPIAAQDQIFARHAHSPHPTVEFFPDMLSLYFPKAFRPGGFITGLFLSDFLLPPAIS